MYIYIYTQTSDHFPAWLRHNEMHRPFESIIQCRLKSSCPLSLFRGSFVSTIQIAEQHSGIGEKRVSRLIRRGARHDFMGEVLTEWRGILSRKNRGRRGTVFFLRIFLPYPPSFFKLRMQPVTYASLRCHRIHGKSL